MRWSACCAPLVTRTWSGSVRHAEAGQVGGDLPAQGRQAERVVAAVAEEGRQVVAHRGGHRLGDDRSGRKRADGELDGVVDERGQQADRRLPSRPSWSTGMRTASESILERREVWLRQAGPSRGDPRAAPLAAAGEAGQAKAVVRGDDRGAAEGEFARQLALRRQAGPGGQQPEVDGPCEGRGELLVQRVGAIRPGPDELDERGRGDHRLPFQSTCGGLAIGLVAHARHDARSNSPMSRRRVEPTPLDRKGRAKDMMFDQVVAALAVAAIFIAPLVAFAAAALRFGVDSRPGIDDRDSRPWLVPPANRGNSAQTDDPGATAGVVSCPGRLGPSRP